MPVPQELTDAMKQIDAETNNLATVVQQLRDAVKTGMTQADVDSVKGTLDGIANRLHGIGTDPNNPVPPGPAPQFTKGKKP